MKQKQLLKPLFLLCALLVGGLNSVWAEEAVYSTCLFGSDYNSQKVSSYTGTWTTTNGGFTWSIANGNNNNNGWAFVKFGRKNTESVGSITTSDAYTEAITKVDLTIDAITTANINSIKLYTSSNNSTWTEAGSFDKATGKQSLSLSSPTKNLYYKIEFDCASGSSNGLITISKVEYYYEANTSDTRTATTTTIDDAGITNTNVFEGTAAGSLSASVAAGETSVAGATVIWSGNNDKVATIDASTGAVTLVDAGTVTFTATYAGDETNYKPSSDTYEMTVTNVDPNAPGSSAENAYTVAQARAAIDAGTGVEGVYVKGIVSEIVTAYNSQYGNISYNISDDGSTTVAQLKVYRGKSYNGENFTSANDIQSGDVVVVKGNLINYNNGTYEFDEGSQLVSLQRKELSSITLSGTYTTTFVEGSEFNHNGVVVTATYSDNSTADVTDNATFSTPDMTQIGTQTITVTYQEKTATYDITITAAPSHTVTYSINGEESTTDFKENADITFPADPEAISGMQFIGWTDAEISGTTNTAPILISTATMGTTDVTYYAVFAAVTPGDSETVTDELTNTTTGVEGSTYTEWTATGTSGAEYAGQSAGGNSSIQLRSEKSTSGIISTTSAGRVKEVVVEWNTNTADGRTLDIYGKNTAYTKVTELYATGQNSNQGTKLGSIVNGTSTKLTIEGDYAYIGLRSYTGAMYLDKISITWESPDIYSNYCTTIPTSIDITVSSYGYKAYNTVMATDFEKTEGLQAFAVTGYTTESVTLTEVKAAPAGTPLVLKADGGDYTLYAAEETPAAPANLLKVSNGTVKGDGTTIYALAKVDDSPGFYVVESGRAIPTNYIKIENSASNAPALSFDFGEGTTGIRSIENGQLTIDNVYYDLSGRKLNAMPTQKGVYIVNGKKVVIK